MPATKTRSCRSAVASCSPDARAFGLSGTARVDPNAPDSAIDAVLGTTTPGATYRASSHLLGDADARASRAFDGSASTAWTAAIGSQQDQWIGVELTDPVTIDGLTLGIVADGKHSIPQQMHLEVDGTNVRTLDLPPIQPTGEEGHVATVSLSFPSVTGRDVRLVVDRYQPVDPDGSAAVGPQTLPVALAGVTFANAPVPAAPAQLSGACRDDLLAVDGAPVSVRLTGAVADARRGLSLESCGGPLDLSAGSHTVTSATGLDGGIDIDRVVLSSDAAGAATSIGPRGAPLATSGAAVRVVDSGSTSLHLAVRTDGKPFWLVFGESHNAGWQASTSGGVVGPHRLVDGYANGWLIRPTSAGTMTIDLRWTPQRLVWIGFVVSGLAIVACAWILIASRRRRRRAGDDVDAEHAESIGLAAVPASRWPVSYGALPASLGRVAFTVATVTLLTAVCSRLWIGVVAGAVAVVVAWVPRSRLVVAAAIPLLVAASRITHTPELAWLAIALLVVDLIGLWLHRPPAGGTATPEEPPPRSGD